MWPHLLPALVYILALRAIATPVGIVVDTNPRNLANPGPIEERSLPVTVEAPAGTLIGKQGIRTETFNGIPFAQAPTGNLRLRPPLRFNSTLNNFDATPAAPACPQFVADSDAKEFLPQVLGFVSNTPLFQQALKISEDCLNLNVIRPKGAKSGDNLPVLFWMFGGGFEVKAPLHISSLTVQLGWSSMYDASGLVSNAIAFGKPYIFVGVNYRVGGFGFMPGKEVRDEGAANLGHLDQRMGLEWVADNIAAFGGDPSKVTIWGESAGSMSVFNQMALYNGDHTYKGKPLFRGAIMNSGSMIPTEPVDGPKGQAVYDAVVAKTSCFGQNDTLNCLRELPYKEFLEAANSVPHILSYNSVSLSYLPRPDGTVLPASTHTLAKEGRYAAVPMIIGDQEDEGTLFALFQANISSTTEGITGYLHDIFFPRASIDALRQLVETYPQDPSAGSPFRTGILNEIYPGFKRLAALLGDIAFTLTRRTFLRYAVAAHPSVPAWSYMASYAYLTPVMGTFHASDLIQVFFGVLPNYASKGIQRYYANFVYNLDPNDASGGGSTASQVRETWPRWDAMNLDLAQFFPNRFGFMKDDFRSQSDEFIQGHMDDMLI